MAKTIGFIIEIEGTQKTLNSVKEINKAIKSINKSIDKTDDPKKLNQLNKNLNQLKGQLSNVRKEQKQAQKEFAAANFGVGSVIKMKTELKGLELQFNKLSREERNLFKGKKLAKRIKGIRNEIKAVGKTVGKERLSDIIGKGIKEQLPFLNKFQKGIGGIGTASSGAGKLLSGAFAAFAIGGIAIQGLQALGEFVNKFKEFSRQVEITFDVTGEKAQELTANIKASSDTFGTSFEENVKAVNAVVQAFGVEASEAINLVDSALLSSANQGQTLSSITTDIEKLVGLGINEDSALALIVEAGNKDFNINAFTKVNSALRAQTDKTVESLEAAFGEEATKRIFETFAEAPLEAVKLVSTEFNKLDDKSLESAKVLKDVFQVSSKGVEDLATIKNLAKINTSLEDLQANAGATASSQERLLEANKELASAQAEVATSLTGAADGAQLFGVKAKTFLFKTLGAIIEAVKPAIEGIKNFFGALTSVGKSMGLVSEEGSAMGSVVSAIARPFKILGFIIGKVSNFLSGAVTGTKDFIEQSPILTKVTKVITAPFRALVFVLSNIPAIFSGIIASAKQAGTNVKNFFKKLAIDVQILYQKIQSYNPFADSQENIDAEIKTLQEKRKVLEAEYLGIGEAFTKAFNESIEEGEKNREKIQEEARQKELSKEKEANDKLLAEEKEANSEKNKAAREASRKRREERRKIQEKELQDLEKNELARLMLIQELGKRVLKAEIENLKNGRKQAMLQERLRFSDLLEARKKQLKKITESTKAQDIELVKVFGEGSKTVKAFRAKAAQDLLEIKEQSKALEVEQEKKHREALIKINQDFDDKASKERIGALQDRLGKVEKAFNLEELKLEELRAKNLVGEKQFFEARKEAILEQIKILGAQEGELEALIKIGVEVEDNEFENIILKKQQLNTELAKLEADQTKDVELNSEKRSTSRIEEFEKSFQEVAGFVTQGLDIVTGFLDIAAQKDQARLDTAIEERENSLNDLNERLGEASGLEKKFIKQQIDQEIEAREKLAKEQERITKKVAAQQKAVALVQAAINGALAITNVLATLIDPTPVQAFKAVAVAITIATVAAQIATIAAQPLAEGGIVGAQPAQLGSGRITRAQNIPTRRNGDNVLATVKRGEVVLNRVQQARLGGAPVFRAARVPGFASGGLAGAPITAPITSSTLAGATGQDFGQVVNLLKENIKATNNRIDRLQVNLDLDNFDETQTERNDIKKTAQLS